MAAVIPPSFRVVRRTAVVAVVTAFTATYLLGYFFGQGGYFAGSWLLIGATAGATATITSIISLRSNG